MKEFIRRNTGLASRERLKTIYRICTDLIFSILDLVLAPLTLFYAIVLKAYRKRYFRSLPLSRTLLMKVGVYPINDHYYEPLFNPARLRKPLSQDRNLPGLDLNVDEQLALLDKFNYNAELLAIPQQKTDDSISFSYDHGPFNAGDAEYLYSIIRLFKPARIIEIGCGSSTLMAINAIRKNKAENPAYSCDHICIEPYENPWLQQCDITVVRKLVEEVDPTLFQSLGKGDILFIDSSHMIRPQGDVLFEYLELLPVIKPGVLVHIHDIFTPKDYPEAWIVKQGLHWNEQYLLEAFLCHNRDFRILGALNYLMHHHYEAFSAKCPVLHLQGGKQPGSFWMQRN